MTFKEPYYGYTTSAGTFNTTSASTTVYYPDRYGYGASGGAGGGSFVSDRELYMEQQYRAIKKELEHQQEMLRSLQYRPIPLPLESPKPTEPDNIAWLRGRVEEITKAGKLAA